MSGIAYARFNAVYARGIRGVLRSMDISDEEAEDLTQEEFDSFAAGSPDSFKDQAKEIERDSSKYQHFLQQKTIKQKYFKQYEVKEDNFLTWSMKEQLKYLHFTDPDTWTPEALATAFPISASGAMKLLKAKWVPENEAAIERHDKAVMARWRKYTNGQLGSVNLLEEVLKKKLGKNSEKVPVPLVDQDTLMSTLESLQFEHHEKPSGTVSKNTKFPKVRKPRSGSFVSIIEDYEAQINKDKESDQGNQSKETQSITSKHISASVIIPEAPEYEGTSSAISLEKPSRNRIRKKKKQSKTSLITFDEFMKKKSKAKDLQKDG